MRLLLKEYLGHLVAHSVFRGLELHYYLASEVVHGDDCLVVARIIDCNAHHWLARGCGSFMPDTVRPSLDCNYVFTIHLYACFQRAAAVVIVELHANGDSARLNALQLDDMLF